MRDVHEPTTGINQVTLPNAPLSQSYGQPQKQTQANFGQASGVAPGTASRIFPSQVDLLQG
jgi:hypothetical protein